MNLLEAANDGRDLLISKYRQSRIQPFGSDGHVAVNKMDILAARCAQAGIARSAGRGRLLLECDHCDGEFSRDRHGAVGGIVINKNDFLLFRGIFDLQNRLEASGQMLFFVASNDHECNFGGYWHGIIPSYLRCCSRSSQSVQQPAILNIERFHHQISGSIYSGHQQRLRNERPCACEFEREYHYQQGGAGF